MNEHYGHVTGQWFYGCDGCWGGNPNGADMPDKRLMDAELAAEWCKANSEGWCNDALHGTTYDPSTGKLSDRDGISDRIEVWHRFATHPHYDEGQDTPG